MIQNALPFSTSAEFNGGSVFLPEETRLRNVLATLAVTGTSGHEGRFIVDDGSRFFSGTRLVLKHLAMSED